jgi:uncharacterized protein YbcI
MTAGSPARSREHVPSQDETKDPIEHGNPVTGADARRAISRRVIGLLKEYVGRGPTAARTVMFGDLVLCVFSDSLTKGERMLAEQDQDVLVREMRRAFLRAMGDEIKRIVAEETGREVVTLLGDHGVQPDHAFVACVVAAPDGSPAGEGDGSAFGQVDDISHVRDQQREISRGMVALYKEYIGRGPTVSRTYVENGVVASLLAGTLTRTELTLAEGERPDSVREMRREFQAALSERASAIVAEATGAVVTAFLSDHSIDPDYALEVFLLEDLTGTD